MLNQIPSKWGLFKTIISRWRLFRQLFLGGDYLDNYF